MRSLGPYKILDELGRGGQGVVFLAEDTRLKRKVALKVLEVAGLGASEGRLERFRREAEAASKLDHPNICAIHEAGEVDGVPYIAMRFIEGETLAHAIEHAQRTRDSGTDATPSSRDAIHAVLRRIEKVARALHVAHERGLIHRDIKPGNIMLTGDGEPVILDFGLARDELAGELTLTHSGDLLGTPAYMSPEQLMAQRIPLDRRTDIYSLGATLYECLTLQRPFVGRTRAELYQRIMTQEPSRATSHNRAIPPDLQVVLETALEKDRDRRYQTALDFADDLRRVREFEPIRAKPIGNLLRLRRWAQRHPALATGGVLTNLALAMSLLFLVQQNQTLRRTRASALAQAAAQAVVEDPQLALLLGRRAMALDPGVNAQSQLLHALATNHLERDLGGQVGAAEFAPSGDRILVQRGSKLEWTTLDGAVERTFEYPGSLRVAKISADGRLLMAAGKDGIRVWDVSGTVRTEIPGFDAELLDATISPDGTRILGAVGPSAHLWDLSGRELARFEGHRAAIAQVTFAPSGDRILTAVGVGGQSPELHARGTENCTLRVWNLRGELVAPELVGHEDSIVTATFSADGARVVSASRDGTARIWDLSDGSSVVLQHGARVLAALFHPDDQRVLTSSYDRTVRLWTTDGEQLFRTWQAGSVQSAVLSRDGSRIAASCADTTVRILDLEGREIAVLQGHRALLSGARFSPDGTRVVSWDEDGECRLWRLDIAGFPVFRGHRSHLYSVEFSADGSELLTAAGSGDCTAIRWSRRTQQPLATFAEHIDYVFRAAYARQMDRIVTASEDGRAIVWDPGGRILAVLEGHGHRLWDARISPDGSTIATGGLDGTARLWNRQGEAIARLDTGRVSGLAFSADSRWLLVSASPESSLWDCQTYRQVRTYPAGYRGDLSPDGALVLCPVGNKPEIRLLDRDGTLRTTLRGHEAMVTAAKFSHGGDRIISTSRDSTARIWDLDGNQLLVIRGHRGFLWDAAFSPDDRYVATCSVDGTARICPIDPEQILRLAEERTLRDFLPEEHERFRELLGR